MLDTCSKFVEALFKNGSFKESRSIVVVIYDRDIKSRDKSYLRYVLILLITILSLLISLKRAITINVYIKLVLCSSHRNCDLLSIIYALITTQSKI